MKLALALRSANVHFFHTGTFWWLDTLDIHSMFQLPEKLLGNVFAQKLSICSAASLSNIARLFSGLE